MTLKKSFVTSCLMLVMLGGMAQMASAQDILIIWNSATRNQGNHWGMYDTLTYDQGLEESFRTMFPTANYTRYDMTPDSMGLKAGAILTSTTEKVNFLNDFDLIFISASIGSGNVFGGAGNAAGGVWNSQVTAPIFTTKTFLHIPGRWDWFLGSNPAAHVGTTATETLDLTAGGSVRLFDPSTQYNVIWTNVGGTGIGDVTTTVTHITQRLYVPNMSGTTGEVVASFPGFTGNVAGLKFTTTGVPFYADGVSTSAFTVGGPRLLLTIEDDRILLDPAFTDTDEADKKMANSFEYLSEEGTAWLRNQLVSLNPTALGASKNILVVDGLSAGTNGGRGLGYFWGPNQDDIYEADVLALLREYYSPTAAVDFYELGESDYMNLQGLTATTTTQLAFLNSYDLVWVGHNCNTSQIANNAQRSRAWSEGVTVPLVLTAQYAAQTSSNRWGWTPAGGPSDNNQPTTPTDVLVAQDLGHPAFDNITLGGSNEFRLFTAAPYTPNAVWFNGGSPANISTPEINYFSQRSNVDDMSTNNGNQLATFQGTEVANWINIVQWDAGTPYHSTSPYTPLAPRLLLNITDNRNQIDPDLVGGAAKAYSTYSQLTPEGKQFLKDLINSLVGMSLPVELGSFELE